MEFACNASKILIQRVADGENSNTKGSHGFGKPLPHS